MALLRGWPALLSAMSLLLTGGCENLTTCRSDILRVNLNLREKHPDLLAFTVDLRLGPRAWTFDCPTQTPVVTLADRTNMSCTWEAVIVEREDLGLAATGEATISIRTPDGQSVVRDLRVPLSARYAPNPDGLPGVCQRTGTLMF